MSLSLASTEGPDFFLTVVQEHREKRFTLFLKVEMQQTACWVVNPIKIYNFAYLFDCTTVGWASD